jgi:Tol biopolymer transport system component
LGLDGKRRIWIRSLDSLEAHSLVEISADFPIAMPLIWSPDSRFIAFYDGEGGLRKVDASGGPATAVCDLEGAALGGSWNNDGVIIFGDYNASGGLKRVSAAGGSASQLTIIDPTRQELFHSHPTFLSDGKHFIYFCSSATDSNIGIYIGSLDAEPEEQSSEKFLSSTHAPIYVPSRDSDRGLLLFLREQTLMALPFDEKHLRTVGDPRPVAENVGAFLYHGYYSASDNEILIYRSASASTSAISIMQPTWFDRQSEEVYLEGDPGLYLQLDLSPNGEAAAICRVNSLEIPLSADLWLLDFRRDNEDRFTFGQGINLNPVWSPDSKKIIFSSARTASVQNIYIKPASGAENEELLFESEEDKRPTSWSSDGKFLLYEAVNSKTKSDLWILPIEGNHKPMPFLCTHFDEFDGQFSPDMRWIAYVSDESGREEIYVRGFSKSLEGEARSSGGQWQVSTDGGTNPLWREDGAELYFLAPDGRPMAVEVTGSTAFEKGTPKLLSQTPIALQFSALVRTKQWDVTPDGSRFLTIASVQGGDAIPFTVTLNWTSLLEK